MLAKFGTIIPNDVEIRLSDSTAMIADVVDCSKKAAAGRGHVRNKPMCYREGIPLRARRVVIAQVLICRGCCCGAVDKGKPEVPVNWLKQEWKTHKLKNAIQNSNSILICTAGDKFRGLSGQESSNSHREQN